MQIYAYNTTNKILQLQTHQFEESTEYGIFGVVLVHVVVSAGHQMSLNCEPLPCHQVLRTIPVQMQLLCLQRFIS